MDRRIGAEQAIRIVIPGQGHGPRKARPDGLEPGIQRLLREIPGSHAQEARAPRNDGELVAPVEVLLSAQTG
jgi:hypothetical protein